jgi:DNA repair protein RadD
MTNTPTLFDQAKPTVEGIILRPVQIEPVRIGVDFLRRADAKPSIIVAPTAFGKSIVIAKIAAELDEQIIILQPSKELLEQNFRKFISIGGKASIYSASFGQKQIGKVTYATIGSIADIGKIFKDRGFKKMIVDEAHLYPRESESMFGKFLLDSGITHVLGLTATPLKLQQGTDRNGDRVSKLLMLTSRSKKGDFFKDVIHVTQVEEMTSAGYWSPLVYEQHDIDDSKLVYNSNKAEFTDESLKLVYSGNSLYQRIIDRLNEPDMIDRKSIIVFVPSVADAQALEKMVPGSAAVSASLKPADRTKAVTSFKKGGTRIVFNVNVLATGFDHPGVDAIIMARPTASFAWYYQALGRGTRIDPSGVKKDCLVIDLSGNVNRFGAVEKLVFRKVKNTWKLYGENDVLLTGVAIHRIGEVTLQTEIESSKIRMPFGKYKGVEVCEIPRTYRQWMLSNISWNHSTINIKKEIERLEAIANAQSN